MAEFVVDANRNISAIRAGSILGGFYGHPTPTADTWYRLMWQSDVGEKVASDPIGISIGALRGDIRGSDIRGWDLRILTEGYRARFKVAGYDATTGIAKMSIYRTGNVSDILKRFPATFDFLLYPEMLSPLTVQFTTDATTDNIMDIGYTAEDAVDPSTIIHLSRLANGAQFILPTQEIDKIFYRFPSVAAGSGYSFSWGEHYVT